MNKVFIWVNGLHLVNLGRSVLLLLALALVTNSPGVAKEGRLETTIQARSESLVENAPAEVAVFISSVVKVTDMAALNPPSPDPSGITYLPFSNTLMVSDGEVEETVNGISHFQGANIWELALDGKNIRTTNVSNVPPIITKITNEPVGIAYNPENGHYYLSDDDLKRVFDVDPGEDQVIFTADDTWVSFSTGQYGNTDPEGITYDTRNHHIFTTDGVSQEIYEYSIQGALISHFDVQQYNVADPESVEFNPLMGTLFVMSSDSKGRVIIECTTSGKLVQVIDIMASKTHAAAGLAYAPASDGSGAMHFYIVERGIDNNTDPTEMDGRLIEMTAPDPRYQMYLPIIAR